MNVLKVTSLEKMEHVLVCTANTRWSDSDISAHFRSQGDGAGCWWEGLDPEHLLGASQGLMGVGEDLLPGLFLEVQTGLVSSQQVSK